MDETGPEVPIFARAILIAHQREAIPYFDMRIEQQMEAGKAGDAAFWKALKDEAERQIVAGEWSPRE